MKDDRAYLQHILEAILKIETYIAGLDYEGFAKDDKTFDAVVREFTVVGEAAKNVSEKYRDEHPDIPFRDALEMRNVLIHEYFGIDTKIVWDTAKKNIPPLKKAIAELLAQNNF